MCRAAGVPGARVDAAENVHPAAVGAEGVLWGGHTFRFSCAALNAMSTNTTVAVSYTHLRAHETLR